MKSPGLSKLVNDIIIGGGELTLSLMYSNHAEVRAKQRSTDRPKVLKIDKHNIESIEEDEDGGTVLKAHVQLKDEYATVFVLSLRSLEDAYVITTYPKEPVDRLIKEWKMARLMEETHRLPRRKKKKGE